MNLFNTIGIFIGGITVGFWMGCALYYLFCYKIIDRRFEFLRDMLIEYQEAIVGTASSVKIIDGNIGELIGMILKKEKSRKK